MDIKSSVVLEQLKARVDKGSPVPLYYQIEKQMEHMLESGTISEGDMVPGDLSISKHLDISHLTVRKAFANLQKKGLINRIKKSGTFVSETARRKFPSVGFFYFKEAEVRMLRIAEHMQFYLEQNGFDLKIIGFGRDYFEKNRLINEIQIRDLAGAIIVTLQDGDCIESLRELEASKFPHIRFGNAIHPDVLSAPLVRGNDRKRLQDAISFLWDLGHRKIGLISNLKDCESQQEYRDFYCKRKGFKNNWAMSISFYGPPEQWDAESGSRMMRGYLYENSEITAVMVEHISACIEVLQQASALNRKVPEELSIMSLFDYPEFDFVTPRLTAMYLPEDVMAEEAVRRVLSAVRKEQEKKEKISLIDFVINERDSIARPFSSRKLVKTGIV